MRLLRMVLHVILIGGMSGGVIAQIEKDYNPIRYTGEFPPELAENFKAVTKSRIDDDQALSGELASTFYQSLAQTKYDLFQSGQVYFGGELHDYVNRVCDRLLQTDPALRKEIKLYVTRFGSANGFALPDGSLFINIGLFNVIDNEHQLAFIIAHEIAHYEKQHAVKSAAKADELKKSELYSYNPKGTLFRRLKLSREDESEADTRGLQIMASSPYDINEAPMALKHLENDSVIDIENITSVLRELLETEEVKFDSAVFAKDVNTSDRENAFLSESEDLYTTHPNIDKRVIALREMIQLNEVSDTEEGIDQSEFDKIKRIAAFEMVKNTHDNSNYLSSLFMAIALHREFPENKFLQTYLLKNLYWLSYYSEIDKLDNVAKKTLPFRSASYDTLASMTFSINHNDLKKVSFFYAKSGLDQLSDHEDFYIYYAMMTELYLGRESAKMVYNNYLRKFKQGRYKRLALYKTKEND